jgi:hypothetical protein
VLCHYSFTNLIYNTSLGRFKKSEKYRNQHLDGIDELIYWCKNVVNTKESLKLCEMLIKGFSLEVNAEKTKYMLMLYHQITVQSYNRPIKHLIELSGFRFSWWLVRRWVSSGFWCHVDWYEFSNV